MCGSVKGIKLGRVCDVPENDKPFGANEEEIVRYWCAKAGIAYLGPRRYRPRRREQGRAVRGAALNTTSLPAPWRGEVGGGGGGGAYATSCARTPPSVVLRTTPSPQGGRFAVLACAELARRDVARKRSCVSPLLAPERETGRVVCAEFSPSSFARFTSGFGGDARRTRPALRIVFPGLGRGVATPPGRWTFRHDHPSSDFAFGA